MIDDVFECDDEGAVARRHLAGVVPFEIGGSPVPEIDGFPERIVTWEESPIGSVEFIGEDEFVG
jgi:hypothetical protein